MAGMHLASTSWALSAPPPPRSPQEQIANSDLVFIGLVQSVNCEILTSSGKPPTSGSYIAGPEECAKQASPPILIFHVKVQKLLCDRTRRMKVGDVLTAYPMVYVKNWNDDLKKYREQPLIYYLGASDLPFSGIWNWRENARDASMEKEVRTAVASDKCNSR